LNSLIVNDRGETDNYLFPHSCMYFFKKNWAIVLLVCVIFVLVIQQKAYSGRSPINGIISPSAEDTEDISFKIHDLSLEYRQIENSIAGPRKVVNEGEQKEDEIQNIAAAYDYILCAQYGMKYIRSRNDAVGKLVKADKEDCISLE